MNFLFALILGIVEGITEFLPISSTAHLILTSDLLGLTQSDYTKSFEIIIQLGAILSVVVLYWRRLWNWELIKRLIVAFIPTGVLGLLLYKTIKYYLIGNTTVILWSMFLGGLIILWFEQWYYTEGQHSDEEIDQISYKHCFLIGLFQSIAMIPGVSRSAATIIGGLMLGLQRKTIVEFSFLLAIPTMLAATGLDLVKNADQFSSGQMGLLGVGFITSFVVALFVIKFFLSYIKKHTFKVFGWYRVVAAVVFWLSRRV